MQKHKHGGDIYSQNIKLDYSANISPLGLPKGVREAVVSSVDSLVHYPDVECRRLREKIAEAEQVPMEAVLCGNGAAELIFALAHGGRPQRALLGAPGFAEYEQALLGTDCELDFYELKEENDFCFQEDYFSHITADTDLVFLCNPNNPTGRTVGIDFLMAAARRCRECGAVLVVDECFNEFLDNGEELTMKPYLGEFSNLVILKAFTKIYAMPGLRLGYCLCENPQIIEKIRTVMQPWSVSGVAQAAGTAALEEEYYVEKVRTLIHNERKFLFGELQKRKLRTFGSEGNFIFFRGPVGLDTKLMEKGVLIRNCDNYRGLQPGYYRIAVRGHEENQRLMKYFDECL